MLLIAFRWVLGCVACVSLYALDASRAATFIVREPPYRYGKFLTLLQSQQTHICLGLYLTVTSNLMGRCSYWAPDPNDYLWHHQERYRRTHKQRVDQR
jgi:hypothetical protein